MIAFHHKTVLIHCLRHNKFLNKVYGVKIPTCNLFGQVIVDRVKVIVDRVKVIVDRVKVIVNSLNPNVSAALRVPKILKLVKV